MHAQHVAAPRGCRAQVGRQRVRAGTEVRSVWLLLRPALADDARAQHHLGPAKRPAVRICAPTCWRWLSLVRPYGPWLLLPLRTPDAGSIQYAGGGEDRHAGTERQRDGIAGTGINLDHARLGVHDDFGVERLV